MFDVTITIPDMDFPTAEAAAEAVRTFLTQDGMLHDLQFVVKDREGNEFIVTLPGKAGVPVEDSPLWTPEQRRLALSNHMDYFGKPLGWKDD